MSNNEVFIFQYIFIFVYKSYGLMVEEFFACFCSLVIFMGWVIFGFIFMMLPGKKGINYYMCTGENPENDPYSQKKVKNLTCIQVVDCLFCKCVKFWLNRLYKKQ